MTEQGYDQTLQGSQGHQGQYTLKTDSSLISLPQNYHSQRNLMTENSQSNLTLVGSKGSNEIILPIVS